jgi:oxygen-independent coproporphyrinogen III oxidase
MELPVDSLASLDTAMAAGRYSDYIYMYPPRQAYRQLDMKFPTIRAMVRRALAARNDINLYVHVPFCAQICRFCNLYTTAIRDGDIYRQYTDRVIGEAEAYADSDMLPVAPRWRTLYFGGGTPSALPLDLLDGLLSALRNRLSVDHVEETAIEVAPETVTIEYLKGLRVLGFDRVSMGFQSTSPVEIRSIGRSYSTEKQAEIAEAAMKLGFRNLCLDLIFGLPGQDQRSWQRSLKSVIAMHPHTICCYQWTSRPNTGFQRMGLHRPAGDDMRELYYSACRELEHAGYMQETHVRWISDGGGYLQKQYHWGLQNLLGLGAGARSYFWNVDLRNGYSIKIRRNALEAYLKSGGVGWQAAPEGYQMCADERQRKAIILGIHSLGREWFKNLFGVDPLALFPGEIQGLEQRKLIEVTRERICLTGKGRANRDLIVQLFFSDTARTLTREWTYDE